MSGEGKKEEVGREKERERQIDKMDVWNEM